MSRWNMNSNSVPEAEIAKGNEVVMQFCEDSGSAQSIGDLLDAVEQAGNKLGFPVFGFWTFPKDALDSDKSRIEVENLPWEAYFRGPAVLKAYEAIYFRDDKYKTDPSVIAACNRNTPFSSVDLESQKPGWFNHSLMRLMRRFSISDDIFIPLHMPSRIQVVWFGRFGGEPLPSPLREEAFLHLRHLAGHFTIAANEYLQLTTSPDNIPELSVREAQCLVLMARGMSNNEIAQELHITARTVKFHLTNVNHRLGTKTRAETLVRAGRLGLLVN